jgi:predicted kinase
MGNTTNAGLTLALMAGLPGAGKTTLSIELGRELGWHVINKDRFKMTLLDMGMDDLEASQVAYRLSFDTALEVLTCHNNSVILDTAALHPLVLEEAREIIRLVEQVGLKIIFCVADRDLRNYRLRVRRSQKTTIRVDPETIADYFHHFKHLPPEPERLTLHTNCSLEQCLKQAKEYLLQDMS